MRDTPFEEPRIPAGEGRDVREERTATSRGRRRGEEWTEEDGTMESAGAADEEGEGPTGMPGAGEEAGDGAEDAEDAAAGDSADSGDEGEPVRRPSSRVKRQVGALLSGSILSKAEVRKFYPYMLLLAFLMLLYIANVFKMQQLHKQHDRLSAEVKELRAKSLTLSSIRMNATRQSEILKELNNRGIDLEESVTPPKIIDK